MKKITVKTFFIYSMTILIVLFIFSFLNDPEGAQKNIFFFKAKNLFADFFNVLIYTSERDPYFNPINGPGEKAYLPLSYIFLYLFTKIGNYSNLTLAEATLSYDGVLSIVLFSVISIVLLLHSISKLNKNREFNLLQTFILLFSSITLFSIERGNLIIISSSFVIYFLAYYESEDINEKYFSLVALSLATIFKGYPAILGLLLLKKGEYKSIVFCIIFTTIFSFLPFLFFKNGIYNIPQFFKNFIENGNNYDYTKFFPRFGLPHLAFLFAKFFKLKPEVFDLIISISRYFIYLLALLTLYLFSIEKAKWKQIAFLIILLIQLPQNSALYTGLYFLPVIFLFFESHNNNNRIEYIYVLLFILFLNPYQIPFEVSINSKHYLLTINSFVSNISILLIWFLLLFNALKLKYEKSSNNTNL